MKSNFLLLQIVLLWVVAYLQPNSVCGKGLSPETLFTTTAVSVNNGINVKSSHTAFIASNSVPEDTLCTNNKVWQLTGATQAKTFSNMSVAHTPFTIAKQSLKFTENKGQVTDYAGKLRPDILFVAKGNGVKLYLTKQGIIYVWQKNTPIESSNEKLEDPSMSPAHHSVTYQMNMELLGVNPHVTIHKSDQTKDTENHYLAHSSQESITNVNSYQQIRYEEIYPNINLLVYSNEKGFKYDFVVKPGGKVSDIKIRYRGNESIDLLADGSLKITNPLGKLLEAKPLTYSLHKSQHKVINSRFSLEKEFISFKVDAYTPSDTLIIDPAVEWASYYGGIGEDIASAVATDAAGNIYMSGETSSNSGISSAGFQAALSGDTDAFLVKFNATGERLWATYYGGTGQETGRGLTTDKNGNVYLAGQTSSSNAIASNGFQNSLNGNSDAFLVKFNSAGKRIWASYYGGNKNEQGIGTVTDAAGNMYLLGLTNSNTGIAFNGHQNTFGGSVEWDAFLVKFNAAGERLWATYYGGKSREIIDGIVTDGDNNLYFSGFTNSSNNIASNGYQNTLGGGWDAFLVKFNPAGVRQWGTYYGESKNEYGVAPATDANGNVYLAGQTASTSDIAANGHQNTFGGIWDGFLVKFNSAGKRQWGSYYGGAKEDKINKIAVNQQGAVYVAGETTSQNNISFKGIDNSFNGAEDAFVAKFDAAGVRQWATYYGGSNTDVAYGLAIDNKGNAYVAGETSSQNNIAVNGIQPAIGGGKDAFIIKIENQVPLLISSSPADNSTVTAIKPVLSITLNEWVQKGNGTITVYQNSVLLDEIDVKSSSINVNNATVTIDSEKGFTPGAAIYVIIPAGAILDMDGNAFAGINNSTTWNFTVQPVILGQKVTKLVLVNADTEQPVIELSENMTIQLSDLPTMNLNIRAYTNPGTVGSVLFNLNGNFTVQNVSPYMIGGDVRGNYEPWTLPVGTHTLTATPYSESTPYNSTIGNGVKGTPLTIQFKVTGTAIRSLVLLNADSDEDILTLKNGTTIDLAQLPTQRLNIRAIGNPEKPGSILFNLNNADILLESYYPFAIGGDSYGNFNAWTLPVGNHVLKAIPFELRNGGGQQGVTHSVSFSVINSNAPARAGFSAEESHTNFIQAWPNPFSETTSIRFSVAQTGHTVVDVYDAKGLLQASLFKTYAESGKIYTVNFKAESLKSGVFIVRFANQHQVNYYKLVLTK